MKNGSHLLTEAVDFCEQKKWIKKNDVVLLALSGGPDSVFLFYVLLELKKSIPFDLHAIHINHLLRGNESDADETFVTDLTGKHGVKFSLFRVDVAKLSKDSGKSIEMAARDARYDMIYKEYKKIGASVIVTAHNADDRLETAIMRFISGSGVFGISGLKGIREHKNIKIIRPIINFFKTDILKYLEEKKISFRFDSSNNDDIYLRNKVRNRLVPFIEKDFNPNFKNSLLTTISLFEQQSDYLKSVSEKESRETLIAREKFYVFDKCKLADLHPCIISQILIDSLYAFHGVNIRVASYHIKTIVEQINSTSSRTYLFPGNIIAAVDRKYLIMMNKSLYMEFLKKQNFSESISPGKAFSFNLSCGLSIDVSVSGFSDKQIEQSQTNTNHWDSLISGKEIFFFISLPFAEGLVMRFRKEGDKLYFKYGSKKLKKFFIENHIPFIIRNSLPVISSKERVVWAPEMSLNDLPKPEFSGNHVSIGINMKLN